jgi:serine/threonine-protein kinase RIO1
MSGDSESRRLPEQVNKHTLADWKDSAATFVRQQLFDKKQSVTDKELMFGGTIQELVCTDISISDGKRAQIFWDEKGGKETVRNTIRRKRQAAQNAMKLAFRGK